MADPVTPVTPTPTPAPSPAATPGTSSPQAAAETVTAPAVPAPSPSPVAAPPVEAKPAEPAPGVEPAASVPTLLEEFDKGKADAAAKPAEAKPAEPAQAAPAPAKPAEAAPGTTGAAPPQQPAAPSPVEYKYTLPDTMKMDDALKGTVHKAFDDFRANPAEGAQGLVNLHEQQMRAFAQHMADEQQRAFTNTRQEWQKKTRSDQELGGSGHQTAMGAIARMRDMLVPEQHRPAFEEFLRVTGAGDHPEFLRILHQAARFYDEPAMPSLNPRPPPNNGQRPNRRLRDIYDHPRSSADGRS